MKLLERHFEMALAAPDGIKKLRELILTLAMQGKLVPQDPSDQPASELLKEIEAEKRRLVKEGKLKKQETLPPIKPEQVPYEVPAGWEWVRLGAFTEIIRGITFPANEKTKEVAVGRIACLRTSNVQETIQWDDMLHIDRSFMKHDYQLVNKNDIIMSMANSRELVGKVAIVDDIPFQESTIGGFLSIVRTILVLPLFLKHILRTEYARNIIIANSSQTTNIANISLGKLYPLIIPLPPLAEQKRIVAKIDQLMAVCDRLEAERNERNRKRLILHRTAMDQLLSAIDAPSFAAAWSFIVHNFGVLYSVPENVIELKKAILQLAVMGKLVPQDPSDQPASELLKEIEAEKNKLIKEGKIKKQEPLLPIKPEEVPYEIPAGWEWVRLGDAIFNAMTGIDRGKSLQSIEYQYPYFKMNNISNVGSCDYTQVTNINASQDERNRYSLSDGDFLFNTRNSAELVGKTCVFSRPDEENWLYNNNILKIEFSPLVDNWFANRWFNSTIGKNELNKIKSATTNVAAIYQGKLMNFLLPLPPFTEQKRIIAKVDELMALCDELEQQLKDATDKQTAILNAVVAGM